MEQRVVPSVCIERRIVRIVRRVASSQGCGVVCVGEEVGLELALSPSALKRKVSPFLPRRRFGPVSDVALSWDSISYVTWFSLPEVYCSSLFFEVSFCSLRFASSWVQIHGLINP